MLLRLGFFLGEITISMHFLSNNIKISRKIYIGKNFKKAIDIRLHALYNN